MKALLDKINEYTVDGNPGVSQIIELGDLAKSVGVKRHELEKLIDKAVKMHKEDPLNTDVFVENRDQNTANKKNVTITTERVETNTQKDVYERTDMDAARNSFELEMKRRQLEASEKLEHEDITFNRPEITFPELKFETNTDQYEEPKIEETSFQEVESIAVEELDEVKFEPTEISVDSISIDETEIKVESEYDFSITSKTDVKSKADFTIIDPTEDASKEDKLSAIAASLIKTKEERSLSEEEEMRRYNEKLDQIIARKEKEKQAQKQKEDSETQQNKYTKNRSTSPEKKGDYVDQIKIKSVRTVGIIAIVGSFIAFPVGIFAGLYGYNTAKKYKESMKTSGYSYSKEDRDAVNLASALSIAGIAFGAFKAFGFVMNL